MGFLKKLKKRDDRYARIGKMKAAKKDAKVFDRAYFEKRHEEELRFLNAERSRFLVQMAYLTAIKETFGFGKERLNRVTVKAVNTADCCVNCKMFTLKEIRDQLELETGYDVPLDDHVKGNAFMQETKHIVDEITVFYLWALNDLFGMKAKRLARTYAETERVSKMFMHDSSMVYEKTKEIEDAGLRMTFHGKRAIDLAKEIAKL